MRGGGGFFKSVFGDLMDTGFKITYSRLDPGTKVRWQEIVDFFWIHDPAPEDATLSEDEKYRKDKREHINNHKSKLDAPLDQLTFEWSLQKNKQNKQITDDELDNQLAVLNDLGARVDDLNTKIDTNYDPSQSFPLNGTIDAIITEFNDIITHDRIVDMIYARQEWITTYDTTLDDFAHRQANYASGAFISQPINDNNLQHGGGTKKASPSKKTASKKTAKGNKKPSQPKGNHKSVPTNQKSTQNKQKSTQTKQKSTQNKAACTWVRTERTVVIARRDGTTVNRTVYKNATTGEKRVRKMTTNNRTGLRRASYVKF